MTRLLPLLLFVTQPAFGLELDVSGPSQVSPGTLVILKAATAADARVKWTCGNADLQLYEDSDKQAALFATGTPGEYRILCIAATATDLEVVTHVVLVGKADPQPPDPVPPDPDPTPVPGPLRVLILEETADRGRLPVEQRLIFTSGTVRKWLDEHTAGWRMWDQDVDAAYAPEEFREALAKPRESLPWLYVSDGAKGYSGPLPVDEGALLDLLGRYAK